MRASIALPRAHATASSAKKIDARCQTRISRSIRVFARRSTHLPLFTRVFFGIAGSDAISTASLRLDFFFRSPIEKLKARHEFPLSLFARSLRARPSARAVRADRNESPPLKNVRSSRRSSFRPGNTRAQKRDKSAPNLLRLNHEEKGKTKKKRRRGKKLVQKRKENEATKDEKKKTDEGN